MPLPTCRCGQPLELPAGGSEHVTCPRCSAKVRLIRKVSGARSAASGLAPDDGYVRFPCPCGRRLKVAAADRPTHGKCPDCGRVVPVPEGAFQLSFGANSPTESPTEELLAADVAMLEAWSKGHLARGNGHGPGPGKSPAARPTSTAEMAPVPPAKKAEAGFRVCPRCGKPIHLNAETCRGCGTAVPKR